LIKNVPGELSDLKKSIEGEKQRHELRHPIEHGDFDVINKRCQGLKLTPTGLKRANLPKISSPHSEVRAAVPTN